MSVIPEFPRPNHRSRLTRVEIVPQLLVSTTTLIALLLLGNTKLESKITRSNGPLFLYQLREKIDLYLSQ